MAQFGEKKRELNLNIKRLTNDVIRGYVFMSCTSKFLINIEDVNTVEWFREKLRIEFLLHVHLLKLFFFYARLKYIFIKDIALPSNFLHLQESGLYNLALSKIWTIQTGF